MINALHANKATEVLAALKVYCKYPIEILYVELLYVEKIAVT